MKYLPALLTAALWLPVAQAEPESTDASPLKNLVDRYNIVVRQSATGEDLLEEPASVQMTMPGGAAKNSYAVDIGVSLTLFESEAWSIAPLVEYHRQTETDSEQDNFQAGLMATYLLGDISLGSAHLLQLTSNYKDDNVGTGSGAIGKLEYYFLKPDWAIGADRGPPALRYRWQPMIGAQYESGDDVLKSGQSGHTGRGAASFVIRILPFADSLDQALELNVTARYWKAFSESAAYAGMADSEVDLVKASLNYYFDPDRNVALGLDYANGGDPEKGRADQESTVLAFKFQIGGE